MVNFGIVGFGLHAVKRLMPGFKLAERCRVVALSRRDSERAEQSSRQYQIPHAFTTAEELCQSPEVDAVFVASPNALHLPDVLTAIRYRKPVLCEKPLAMNADECRTMVKAAKDADVLLGVAQIFRFNESTARIRERIATGQIGTPVLARSEFSFFAPPNHPRAWLHDRTVAGGGPIADVGVHCIDTLRFILRDEVVRVSAVGMKDGRSGEVESAAVMALEFARGTLATVSVSFRAEYHTTMEVHGESSSLISENGLSVDFPVTVKLVHERAVVDQETVSNHLAYAKQVDEFADAVRGKAKFRVPGEEGWQNQIVLDAAYRSLETGRAEPVTVVVDQTAV